MGGAFLLTAIWWVGMAFPLIAAYQQKNFTPVTKSPVSSGLKRLARIFSELKEKKKILFFLIAFFFFIDGVYTIIDMATAYGTALGLDTTGLAPGAAADPDRSISRSADLRKTVQKSSCLQADPDLHRSLFLHFSFTGSFSPNSISSGSWRYV